MTQEIVNTVISGPKTHMVKYIMTLADPGLFNTPPNFLDTTPDIAPSHVLKQRPRPPAHQMKGQDYTTGHIWHLHMCNFR